MLALTERVILTALPRRKLASGLRRAGREPQTSPINVAGDRPSSSCRLPRCCAKKQAGGWRPGRASFLEVLTEDEVMHDRLRSPRKLADELRASSTIARWRSTISAPVISSLARLRQLPFS